MIRRTIGRGGFLLAIAVTALFATVPLQAAETNSYSVTPLVSDEPGGAPVVDPKLVTRWGSRPPGRPVVGGRQRDEFLDPYNGATGQKVALEVAVGVDSGPTGVVFNGGSGFVVTNGTQSGAGEVHL